MRERIDILGVGFDNVTRGEAVSEALRLMGERRSAYAVTPNPEIVMLCREAPKGAEAVAGADLVLPDGIGIIKAAALLGTPMKEKVAGIDFASDLMDEMAKKGMSVFLFGAKPGIAEKAAENLEIDHPGIKVLGTADGYFDGDAEIKRNINAASPDLLLVCLGAPKQEIWMAENAGKLNVGLMAGLGGALDVYAGVSKRAPENWRKLGLEWLYRLLKEPKRLGRMLKLPKFLLEVRKQKGRG